MSIYLGCIVNNIGVTLVNQSELPGKLELDIVDKTKLILTAFHYNNNNNDDDECSFVEAND